MHGAVSKTLGFLYALLRVHYSFVYLILAAHAGVGWILGLIDVKSGANAKSVRRAGVGAIAVAEDKREARGGNDISEPIILSCMYHRLVEGKHRVLAIVNLVIVRPICSCNDIFPDVAAIYIDFAH